MTRALVLSAVGVLMDCVAAVGAPEASQDHWALARQRGAAYEDCGRNAARLLQGWIDKKRDPETHLYSRDRVWDYHNEAADHYSSLVLIARYVKPELIVPGGVLHQTLRNSQRLCTTPSGLLALYDLKTHSPGRTATLGELSEWLRDGLVRIVEVLGTDNDWCRELERLTDAMLADACKRGSLDAAFRGPEPAGNMLQTLTRLYAISGNETYLAAAEQLADLYLLSNGLSIKEVRFEDHGCELVPGLGELLAVEAHLKRPKTAVYAEPLRKLLDELLAAHAHPESGLLSTWTTTADGQRRWQQPTDTWGYVLFAYENYDRATGENRYAGAIEKTLRWLVANRSRSAALKDALWPRSTSSDDWSDSYESMIILGNRYRRVAGTFEWLDWATRQHCHRRHREERYGPYTGGHFDGSTGRTLVLHMMLCSQGVRTVPFVEGVRLGAIGSGDRLDLWLESDHAWQGRLCFDPPRCEHKAARLDWARVNEMPQWYVVRPGRGYTVTVDDGPPTTVDGASLVEGLRVAVQPGASRRISVGPVN